MVIVDSHVDTDTDPIRPIKFKDRCHSTKLRRCIWPKKCHITGKNLWLKEAYVQSADWFVPGGIRTEHRWYDQKAFITERLKGNV